MEVPFPEGAPERYKAQVERMRKRMSKWRTDNPNVTAIISFDNKFEVITDVHTALFIGVIKVNEHGYNMLKAMCEKEKELATISMLKLALTP